MIKLRGVKKAFNQGRPNEFWAIQGIDLDLRLNRAIVLKGPSGSGKTTLLSMIGCLSRPTEGRIELEGEPLSGLPERFMTDVRRRSFGFVFQQFNLIRGLSLLENTMLPAYPLGEVHRELADRAMALLSRFGLAQRAQQRVEWLSGGEQQRGAICRALINDPRIVIADEPTANLDSQLSRELMLLLEELVEGGKTLIVSSHDPLVFEHDLIAQVVELRDGHLV